MRRAALITSIPEEWKTLLTEKEVSRGQWFKPILAIQGGEPEIFTKAAGEPGRVEVWAEEKVDGVESGLLRPKETKILNMGCLTEEVRVEMKVVKEGGTRPFLKFGGKPVRQLALDTELFGWRQQQGDRHENAQG
eukprot:TRINITY_DN11076_c0_g2_i1.p3 TRINITY_DN11076_c0_g2~~TRINITY_DN11076_c0_g2_i1.p3  ORF type:complete len:135 (+),score=26.35 TRINITY_DN11076_c0_g2_i1:604-1008(+)